MKFPSKSLVMDTKKYPLITFIITFVVYVSALSGAGVLGNGVFVLETGDWITQHIPFIMQMGEVLKGNHSLWYSWNMGLGCGSIGSYAYYTLSPFNALYWLLGEDRKHIASALIITLKAAASASTFQIFISRFLGKPYFETIVFSLFYALNGFVICYYHSILFLDAVIIFPLIILGMFVLIIEDRIILLIASYTYLFFTSIYMGYVLGVSSFIIFFICLLYYRKGTNLKKIIYICLRYGVSVLVALGLTAFIWLPTLFNIMELRNSDVLYENYASCDLAMLFNNMFSGMYQSVAGFIPYYYCGILTIMSIPLFLLNKRINKRKRAYFVICIITFVMFMLVEPLNIALHGFDRPNGLGYRYSFVLSFILVTILSKQFVFMIGKNGISRRYLICFELFFMIVFIVSRQNIIRKIGEDENSNDIYVFIINFILIFLLYLGVKNYKNARFDAVTKRAILIFLMVVEMIINIVMIHKHSETKETFIVDAQLTSAENNTARHIREESIGDRYIRTIYQDRHIVNISIEKDFSSIVYFSSLISNRIINVLQKFGFEYEANFISGCGWTPVTASLLGIDYIIDGSAVVPEDSDNIVLIGDETACFQKYSRNEMVMPLAFTVDPLILKYKTTESVFDNQDNLLSAMIGKSVDCFKPIDMLIDPKKQEGVNAIVSDNSVIIVNNNFPEKEALLEYCSAYPVNNDVYVNLYNHQKVYKDSVLAKGPVIEADKMNDMYQEISPHIYPNQIFKSGIRDNDYSGFVVHIPANIEKIEYQKGYFVEYDEGIFVKVYEELKSNAMNITEFKDGYVAGDVDCNEDCVLFSSIPYEKGWNAYVDGMKAEVIPLVEDSFVGLSLAKGHHNIVLEYVAPGRYLGRNVTIITFCMLAVTMVYNRVGHKNRISFRQ